MYDGGKYCQNKFVEGYVDRIPTRLNICFSKKADEYGIVHIHIIFLNCFCVADVSYTTLFTNGH